MPWREMGAVFYFVERRRKMWAQFSADSRLKACRVLAHHVNFKRRNVDLKRNECHVPQTAAGDLGGAAGVVTTAAGCAP